MVDKKGSDLAGLDRKPYISVETCVNNPKTMIPGSLKLINYFNGMVWSLWSGIALKLIEYFPPYMLIYDEN